MKLKFKNSSKNEFAINVLISIIAAILIFMGAKIFGVKISIVMYALAIAVSYCRIAVESIEKLLNGKFDTSLISTLAVLIMFAAQEFFAAAVVAVVTSLSKSIYDYIISLWSAKLLDDDNRLKYDVIRDDGLISVYAEDLCAGDVVEVKRNDYLAFNYAVENSYKIHKAGRYTASDEGVVFVSEPCDYDIDFTASNFGDGSSCVEKTIKISSLVYTIAAVIIAFAMFALKLIETKDFFDSFFVLGVYLLFANPFAIDSGVTVAGMFSLKNAKNNGVKLSDISAIEKFSKTKEVLFEEKNIACDEHGNINHDIVKTTKIADVLKVNTMLLSHKDEIQATKVAKVCGFEEFEYDCDEEKTLSIVAEHTIKGNVACVCQNALEDSKKVISFGTVKGKNTVALDSIRNIIKFIKSLKVFKWFYIARVAIGYAVNFAAVAFFASGIGDRFFANMLVETDVSGVDTVSIKNKIIECLLYNDMMAPWLIGLLQLVLINFFVFVAVGFINNDKKLR